MCRYLSENSEKLQLLRNFKISIYEDPENPTLTPQRAFHALLKWWSHLDEPVPWQMEF